MGRYKHGPTYGGKECEIFSDVVRIISSLTVRYFELSLTVSVTKSVY